MTTSISSIQISRDGAADYAQYLKGVDAAVACAPRGGSLCNNSLTGTLGIIHIDTG